MRFNFLSIAALASIVSTASAQASFCSEAQRFGILSVSPTTLSPDQTFTITADLACAVQLDNTPTFLDYYIDGDSEHSIGGPILIARRTYDNSTQPPADKFTTKLPSWFYVADAQYSIRMDDSFARPGPTGESVIMIGSISTAINITGF
ncbi:hypothetical protein FB451DRAFT_1079522 [Mycena latifolia]|nr:hypothetical protein FB451DRAFT_1552365 [Mycena latifolia]KAJ7490749.1 hypothetical protein FB451DRAFT_1079522 [Mycena latifolia]